jgi:hypothetical protein
LFARIGYAVLEKFVGVFGNHDLKVACLYNLHLIVERLNHGQVFIAHEGKFHACIFQDVLDSLRRFAHVDGNDGHARAPRTEVLNHSFQMIVRNCCDSVFFNQALRFEVIRCLKALLDEGLIRERLRLAFRIIKRDEGVAWLFLKARLQ